MGYSGDRERRQQTGRLHPTNPQTPTMPSTRWASLVTHHRNFNSTTTSTLQLFRGPLKLQHFACPLPSACTGWLNDCVSAVDYDHVEQLSNAVSSAAALEHSVRRSRGQRRDQRNAGSIGDLHQHAGSWASLNSTVQTLQRTVSSQQQCLSALTSPSQASTIDALEATVTSLTGTDDDCGARRGGSGRPRRRASGSPWSRRRHVAARN